MKLNLRLGPAVQWMAPGYSWCKRCETPWAFVDEHATYYTERRGVFALCQMCWAELTPQERLPFYRQVYEEWERLGCADREWPDIERAVLAEAA